MKKNKSVTHTDTPQYRSNLERQFHDIYPNTQYENVKLSYVVHKTYTPDFQLSPTIFVETKGYFKPMDRQKQLLVKKQYPNVTFILIFQDSTKVITKGSKTTYKIWAENNGFKTLDIKELHKFKTKDDLIRWALA